MPSERTIMTNPLVHSPNKVKLGVMAFNCSHGSTVTKVPEAWAMSWQDNLALVRMADQAGIEALLPVGRWKGYGGQSNFNNRTFETLTWASGLLAATQNIMAFSTLHVALVHPVFAAKQMVTADQIGSGRLFCLCGCWGFELLARLFGWYRPPVYSEKPVRTAHALQAGLADPNLWQMQVVIASGVPVVPDSDGNDVLSEGSRQARPRRSFR